MNDQPIYVIAYQTKVDDNYWHNEITEDIDPEHGYFTDQSAAQAYVDALDAPGMAEYTERKATFDKRLKSWERKQARAQKLGFTNPDIRPDWPPTQPLPHLVIPLHLNAPKSDENSTDTALEEPNTTDDDSEAP